ncbi:hypothetical protein PTE30175_00498 [Pandoraea terrae]|uniref:Pyridoxamine 5'-phosphate oxidase N-terminal domain-containing protein n=1 Tax=Pandoraea terrae TaxID=1537710 RepID=A0A5E4S353_9BURK|nr:pyridoxamine 5'-phosphate oxidase family protein [Pandoraea terrae]VVD69611.1 hypothetical protein PTE30175_00498 [Pandoraea terrae]
MDIKVKSFGFDILASCHDMSLATVMSDGHPQADLVNYANDGWTLYFASARDSSKVRNIERSEKVSLTIRKPYQSWRELKALSMSAIARILPDDSAERASAVTLLHSKFGAQWETVPERHSGHIVVIKVTPWIINALDYSLGLGHRTVITCSDLASVRA